MNKDYSIIVWRSLAALGAICIILLVFFTVHSLLCLRYVKPDVAGNDSPAAIETEANPAVQSLSDDDKHPEVIRPDATRPAAAPPATIKPAGFTINAGELWQREKGRRDTIENMRKLSREHGRTNILDEKQLKEMEDSGADFL